MSDKKTLPSGFNTGPGDAGGSHTSLVWAESSWRNHPAQCLDAPLYGSSAFLSRYSVLIKDEPFELNNDVPDTTYMLTMNLKSSDFDITCGEFTLRAKHLKPYDIWTTGPRIKPLRGVIKKSAEVFRVVFPQSLIYECFEAVHGRRPSQDSVLIPTQFVDDRLVRRLFTSLHEVATSPAQYAEPLVDAIGVVLGRRLIALASTSSGGPPREAKALARHLLDRVNDYIEANLEGQIYLADLSSIVGLSRTHFAAQFKAATSSSPHNYILARRIARAKRLLAQGGTSIVDIAIQSGFCNQAHFTRVFRRTTGETPARWHRAQS